MQTSVPRPARWRLAALAGVVLAAHAWLLASPLLPAADNAPTRPAPRVLSTRTVALPTPAATTAATAAAPAPRPPARKVRPRASPSTAPVALAPVLPAPPPEVAPSADPVVAQEDTPTAEAPPDPGPAMVAAVEPPTAPAVEPTPVAMAPGHNTVATGDNAGPAPATVPFAPPASARLNYEVQVEYRGVHQTLGSTLDWQHDGESYRLHMVVALPFLGSRVQHSEGRLGRHGLHPQRFSEKTRSERAAHFDEASGHIRYSANTPDAALLPGHQDRLSVFLQLAGLAHARPERFPAGHTVHVPTSGVRDSETWAFEVKGTETIALPKGDVAALHLRRVPRKAFDTTVDVWLAPSQGHLPVRMRITQANGDVADQRLITP